MDLTGWAIRPNGLSLYIKNNIYRITEGQGREDRVGTKSMRSDVKDGTLTSGTGVIRLRQVNVTITVSVPETVADVVSQAQYDEVLHQKVLKLGTDHQIRRAAQMAHYEIQGKVRDAQRFSEI